MKYSQEDIKFHTISRCLNENVLTSNAVRGVRILLRSILLRQDSNEAKKMIQTYKSLWGFIHPTVMTLSSNSTQQEIDNVIRLATTRYVSLRITEIDNDNCLLIKSLLEQIFSRDNELFFYKITVTPLYSAELDDVPPHEDKGHLSNLISTATIKGKSFKMEKI